MDALAWADDAKERLKAGFETIEVRDGEAIMTKHLR